jgi:hypothetical protein
MQATVSRATHTGTSTALRDGSGDEVWCAWMRLIEHESNKMPMLEPSIWQRVEDNAFHLGVLVDRLL